MNSLPRTLSRDERILAGACTGLAAGLLMGLFTATASALAQMGFWHPVALRAGAFFGVEAILGGAAVVITGLLMHFTTCILVGAAFGALLPPTKQNNLSAAFWGVVAGLTTWAILTFVEIPLWNQTMGERVALAPAWWFGSFLLFGAALGSFPRVARLTTTRAPEQEGEKVRELRRAA